MREADARLMGHFGEDGFRRLRSGRIAVVGSGTVGGAFSTHAAMLGIPQTIVDPDRISASNLGTQIFPRICVGDFKADVRAWLSMLWNDEARVEALPVPVEDLGFARLADASLLVSALDSRRSRLWLNLLSQRLRLPMLDLATGNEQQGPIATVALYQPKVEGSACYCCAIAPDELAEIRNEGRSSCPSWRGVAGAVTPPTLASSPLAAITAGWGVLWALEELQGRAEEFAGRMLVVLGSPPRVRMVRLEASRRCLHGHDSWLPLREAADDVLGDVLEDATTALGGLPDALVFVGRTLALGLRCESCGAERGLVRVAQALTEPEAHCRCGSAEELVPLRLTERLSSAEALALAELGWAELGIPQEDVVLAQRGEEQLAYRVHRRAAVQEAAA